MRNHRDVRFAPGHLDPAPAPNRQCQERSRMTEIAVGDGRQRH